MVSDAVIKSSVRARMEDSWYYSGVLLEKGISFDEIKISRILYLFDTIVFRVDVDNFVRTIVEFVGMKDSLSTLICKRVIKCGNVYQDGIHFKLQIYDNVFVECHADDCSEMEFLYNKLRNQ